MHANRHNQNAWLFIIKKTNCSRLQISAFHVPTNAYNQFQLPFTFALFQFYFYLLLFLLYLRKRENEFFFDLKIVLLIESEEMMILFRKKNHLNFICTKVEETNYARFDNLFCLWRREKFPERWRKPVFPGIGKFKYDISFKSPLPPRIFTIFTPIKIRRLLSPPRFTFREIKFLTQRFWSVRVTFEERTEMYRSFSAKYNFALVF